MPLEKPGFSTDVGAAEVGNHTPARCALDEAELEEVRLVDVLDRFLLLAERDRERREADRAAAELDRDRVEQLAVGALEADRVHLVQLERLEWDLERDRSLVPDLGDVADPAQDPVRHPRRATGAGGDLVRRLVDDLDPEDPGRAADDQRELGRLVVAEPERHAEAVAERRRQETGARRRADEREGRQVERERARRGPLADDDVEPEVLERRVEDLLHRPVEPVDLVHEEDVARLEGREDRSDVALALEHRAGDGADADAELLAHDEREARLAEPGRPDEEHVVERLAAGAGRVESDAELLLHPLLADELVQPARAEAALELLLVGADGRGEELRRHAARLSASRTRSSAGASGSV